MSSLPFSCFHCSMPRPPNRSRRKTRTRFSFPSSKPSSSSSASNSNSLAVVIDLDHLSLSSSSSSSNSHLRRFIADADDALTDLRTLVSLDNDTRRLVISCRRSTLRFLGNSLLLSCLVVLGFRALAWLLFSNKTRSHGGGNVVVRRDRSLGGKEVVVARTPESSSSSTRRALNSPLSSAKEGLSLGLGLGGGSETRVSSTTKRLPKWWPTLDNQNWDSDSIDGVLDKQEYQRDANRLIRAITDNRMSGKDIVADDIIQLRRICRTSGVQVSFDTTNTRDSFYRTSVEFMLNVCGRLMVKISNNLLLGLLEILASKTLVLRESCLLLLLHVHVHFFCKPGPWKCKVNMMKQCWNYQRYALSCEFSLQMSPHLRWRWWLEAWQST